MQIDLKIDFRRQPSAYGAEDSYLDMELGIRRDDEGLHHTRVKRRAVDQDGKTVQGTGLH